MSTRPRACSRVGRLVIGAALGLWPLRVHAQTPSGPAVQAPPPAVDEPAKPPERFDVGQVDYTTPRYEPAGFPLLGGNSDIGFEFGAVGTLTRFERGDQPYLWNMDVVLTGSIKGGNGRTDLAQQNYLWQWDLPNLADGHLRLNPLVYFQKTVDQGYFSLGNASSGVRPPGSDGRYYQYIDSEVRARQLARYYVGGPYSLVGVATFRAEAPRAYPGSQLQLDTSSHNADGSPFVRGLGETGIGMLAGGVIYDSRDNEIFPHKGAFHQMGVKLVQGLPKDENIRYGAVSVNFVWLVPLGRVVVFATRALADLELGNVPFYDLFTGGPFSTYDMPGGASGVRGVPSGRYLGKIKVVGNAELRALPFAFHLLGQSFRVGGDVFADTGRVWSDYTFDSPLDGSGIGLKYGLGGGLYLLWGQAALFRLEVAYSPDQEAANPGFPVGIYAEDGVMF